MTIMTSLAEVKEDNIEQSLFSSDSDVELAVKFFDFLPDVFFWVKNCAGEFQNANSALLKELKVESKSKLVGLTDFDFYPPALAKEYKTDDLKVLNTGVNIDSKYELSPNHKGGVGWRITSKTPLYDGRGNLVGTVGVSRKVELSEGVPGPSQNRNVAIVIGFIYKNLEKDIKVADLADYAGVSVSTLERMFKEHVGTTPKKFFLQVRVSTACEYLLSGSKSIKSIGESVGYEDHANFTRAFRTLLGVSPSQYRKIYKSHN